MDDDLSTPLVTPSLPPPKHRRPHRHHEQRRLRRRAREDPRRTRRLMEVPRSVAADHRLPARLSQLAREREGRRGDRGGRGASGGDPAAAPRTRARLLANACGRRGRDLDSRQRRGAGAVADVRRQLARAASTRPASPSGSARERCSSIRRSARTTTSLGTWARRPISTPGRRLSSRRRTSTSCARSRSRASRAPRATSCWCSPATRCSTGRGAVAWYGGAFQHVEGGGDHAFQGFAARIPAILRFAGVVDE